MIKLSDICFEYPDTGIKLLNGICLDICKGESIAIVGSSGGGKTTLMKIISGLLETSSGNREIREDVRLGFVFQSDALLPWLTSYQNMAYALNSGVGLTSHSNLIARELKNVRLGEEVYERYPDQLSGGEKRRLAIAMNLVREPNTLLLDEPTAQLDIKNKWNIQGLLQRVIKSSGVSLILVTHDIEEAVVLADKIYYLDSGELSLVTSVKLSRPRTIEFRNSSEFANYVSVVRNALR